MTSTIECSISGAALPQGGQGRLWVLARELGLLGLDARALTGDGDPASGNAAAELVVTNPVRDRGVVRVSCDGTVTWTRRHGLSTDADTADVVEAIRVVLTRPELGAVGGNGARHVLTASCPLSCLATLISPRAYNALGRALRTVSTGHPTVGHVVDLHRRRMLPDIPGFGEQGICRIDQVLRLAGLPADPYNLAGLGPSDAAAHATVPDLPG